MVGQRFLFPFAAYTLSWLLSSAPFQDLIYAKYGAPSYATKSLFFLASILWVMALADPLLRDLRHRVFIVEWVESPNIRQF
jgi:hypothetical protein